MVKLIFESKKPLTLNSKDMGMALIVNDGELEIVFEENDMWVRIGSWDDNAWENPETSHADIKKLLGKRVRVTIEVIDG